MAGYFRLAVPPVSGVLRPRSAPGLRRAGGGRVVVLFCVGMTVGDYPLGLGQVLAALVSRGDYFDQVVVYDWRMPRALTGLLVGAAFGMSGALFQTITRNPLAAPDVIGMTAGATTAVVGGIVLGGRRRWAAGARPAGGVLAALLVYLLAWRRGTTGYRIILVGIGVSWMCTSATGYLLARAKLHEAQQVIGWLVGNLNDVTWHQATPLLLALAVLVPFALVLSGWLRTLHLGDDVAAGLGTPVQPRGFVAADRRRAGRLRHRGRGAGRVRGAGRPADRAAARGHAGAAARLGAAVGAVVVLGADLLARTHHRYGLPVGVLTGVLGAPFLLWLLARANRAGSGG